MNICLISPAAVQSSNGNYTTASRWKRILQALGHRVELAQFYDGKSYDLMIALHAWRSAKAIQSFKARYANKPLIVALTGTDAYQFIHSHPSETLASIEISDHLVGLHENIANTIPNEQRHKLCVIFQASTLKPVRRVKKNNFEICVAGHLREEKDPLRPAYALRSIPVNSQLYISHYGKAHNRTWQQLTHQEMCRNNRYRWYGEITQALLRIKLSQAKLMVLPSRMEGGANIISEAIMCHLPIIASNIDGSIGLLGDDYCGYYCVENTQQLKELLLRCEKDKDFYQTLQRQCQARRHLFSYQKEKQLWKQLIRKAVNP